MSFFRSFKGKIKGTMGASSDSPPSLYLLLFLIVEGRLLASANLYLLRPTSRFRPTSFLQCDILLGSENLLPNSCFTPHNKSFHSHLRIFNHTSLFKSHLRKSTIFQRRHQFQPQFHTRTPMKTCVPRLRNNDPCVHISLCTGQCVI